MTGLIQNGVTTGGTAATVYQPDDNVNLYRQYLEQAQQARNNTLNKNDELVRGIDLSKVDPRDRPALEKQYDEFRTLAMNAPVGANRAAIRDYRNSVLTKYGDLKNKIGDIVGNRAIQVDEYNRRKEQFDHDGLIQANQWLDAPIVDNDGNIVKRDWNSLALKPEHVFDADSAIQNLINQNTIKSRQLAQHHRSRDGKTVSVDADVLNTNGLNQGIQNELLYNPQFSDALQKGYKKFQSLNPDTQTTFTQYLQDRIKHHYPTLTGRDADLVKDIPAGDGLYAYNYSVKDPNNYVQHINVNSANKEAEKRDAAINLHNNVLGSAARFFSSGNNEDAQSASQMVSQVLKGQKFGDRGNISGVHFGVDDKGKKYMDFVTKTDDYGIPNYSPGGRVYSDDPNWDRKLHDLFNARFNRTPQNMIGENVFNDWRGVRKGIEENTVRDKPKPTNKLLNFGKKIKEGIKGLGKIGR